MYVSKSVHTIEVLRYLQIHDTDLPQKCVLLIIRYQLYMCRMCAHHTSNRGSLCLFLIRGFCQVKRAQYVVCISSSFLHTILVFLFFFRPLNTWCKKCEINHWQLVTQPFQLYFRELYRSWLKLTSNHILLGNTLPSKDQVTDYREWLDGPKEAVWVNLKRRRQLLSVFFLFTY